MTFEGGGSPGINEIHKQLSRIVECQRLRDSPSQAKMLQFIVDSDLKSAEISEADLNAVLFPRGHYDPDTSVGRATASNLRKSLASYYEEEGKDDPIIISIPRGKKYKPSVRYNPRSAACKSYRLGMNHLRSFSSAEEGELALAYFTEAVARDPIYTAAYAAKAQAEFSHALYRSSESPNHWITLAEQSAKLAIKSDPASWRAHVVLGAIACCSFDWKSAQMTFDVALASDPFETSRHFFYLAYLAAIGRMEEARSLAESQFLQSPEDVSARLTFAVIAYLARDGDFHAAHDLVWSAVREQRGLGFAQALLAYVLIAIAQHTDGLFRTEIAGHVRQSHQLLGIEAFPGLALLAAGVSRQGESNHQKRRLMRADIDKALGALEILSRTTHVSHFELALGSLGAEEWDDAIKHLAMAAAEREPKLVWLHLLPVFDPLRSQDGFKALVSSMNLP
jgi:tetratricopeptide (TPR) repeat protein